MSGSAPTAEGGGIFGKIEHDVAKVAEFFGREIVAAENFFGAGTGPAKLKTVLAAVGAGLGELGWNVAGAESEAIAVIDALVALFKKAGKPIG